MYAIVEIAGQQFKVAKDQKIYVHRLENKDVSNLEMIEVQSGAYFGIDDIVRFEDNYGRSS
jgi:mannose-1-phosphate guanylyltransferase/mannose-6-phosphate isomerase